MERRLLWRRISLFFGVLLLMDATRNLAAEPTAAAGAYFDAYSTAVEARLMRQHGEPVAFLASSGMGGSKPAGGPQTWQPVILRVSEPGVALDRSGLAGAMLHHWRGTAFARGATAADFEKLMRSFDVYPQYFAPEVLRAGVSGERGGHVLAWMRIRQRHVITVVMDTAYDVTFSRLDARHGYSISRSTEVKEIASPGTGSEHALKAGEDHGFLWRLNTYWSYEERDGGLYLQIEAVSLTRSIPSGFGWVIGPYIESIPRESLEFTLNSACKAIAK